MNYFYTFITLCSRTPLTVINNRYVNISVNTQVAKTESRVNSSLLTELYLKVCFNLLCQLILYFIPCYITPFFYYPEKGQEVLAFNHLKSYANIISCLNKRFFILCVFFAKYSRSEKLFQLFQSTIKKSNYFTLYFIT